jgi:hypothetical protein
MAVQVNAATFAGVCLLSRLSDEVQAFTMLTLALLMFACWPHYRRVCVRDEHMVCAHS